MRYFLILLTTICILGPPFAADIYGGDSANVIKESKSSAAIAEQYPDTETQSGEKTPLTIRLTTPIFQIIQNLLLSPKGSAKQTSLL